MGNFGKRTTLLLAALLILSSAADAEAATIATHSVYWDVSKGTVDNYTPTGRYSVLVDHLAPQGYSFTEGFTALDQAPLSNYDVLVIAAGSTRLSNYSAAELDRIENFVRVEGKGLLLLTEAFGTGGYPRVRPVAQRFGADMSTTNFTPSGVTSTVVLPHASTAGVTSIYLQFAAPILPGQELSPYVFQGTKVMLAAAMIGPGKMVMIGDGDLFSKAPEHLNYLDQANNRQLASSTFAFLVPEPSTICALAGVTACTLCSRRRVLP